MIGFKLKAAMQAVLCVAMLGVSALPCAAQAAPDWHISDFGNAAYLPDSDNDGPGNRMARGSCQFTMDRSGNYTASLLAYHQRGMLPYSSASLLSQSWEILQAMGQLERYSPHVSFANLCVDPSDPSTEEFFYSDWFAVDFTNSTPNFECPGHRPQLIGAWCMTAAYW